MDVLGFLITVGKLILALFGVKPKLSKAERQEAREYSQGTELGRVTEHAAQADQAIEAQKSALDLETRMQEAQAEVLAGKPPQETPHEGMDLFHQ